MSRTHCQLVIMSCLIVLTAVPVSAQNTDCKPEQFASLVDQTGEYLRVFSNRNKPILHKKFERLAVKRRWPATAAVERGYRFVQDRTLGDLDLRARQLIVDLDRLDGNSDKDHSCQRLERLKKVTLELRAVTEAKFAHMSKRVDYALKTGAAKASLPRQKTRDRSPPPQWQTTTRSAPPPAVIEALPPPVKTAATYTAEEISAAGRGFFGSISAELASVIGYTFQSYGAPNGYILGSEGGGAFLAGLTFGKGQLTTRSGQRLKVYWQSPTVGYDLGAQGSRVMFLVYNLEQPEHIYRRFIGVGGSAYVVGGVGLTYHMRGKVVLAPIRTGIGLRVGANIGYLKFTPRPSINPF